MRLPELHDWQRRVLREARRFNVLACGRRWGKTTLALDLLIDPALDRQPVAYFTPTYKMLDEFWRIVCSVCVDVTHARNASSHRLDLITGGVIDMWSLTEPNVARGRKYARVVFDEAAMVDDLMAAWSAVVRPTLADYEGDAWFVSTPKGHNDFETLYHRDGWASWQRPTADNPYILPDEIQAMRRDLGDIYAAQEIDAEFIDAELAERYLPSITIWDACRVDLPPLDQHTPLVLAADAGVSNDCFALVGVSRHPDNDEHVAVRYVRVWSPHGGTLDFDAIESEIREVCATWDVLQLAYDPYQLHHMMRRLQMDGVIWTHEFNQGMARLEADKQLLDLIFKRQIAHDGNAELRQHLDNADRKVDAESRTLRIVKRRDQAKVDLAVALSMATDRCLRLNL